MPLALFPSIPPSSSAEGILSWVKKARGAFPAWRDLSFRERAFFLEKVRRQLAREAQSWAWLITDEIGKPVLESLGAELLGSLEALQTLLREGEGWVAPQSLATTFFDWIRGVRRTRLLYEPCGVIGIIGTWNYPLLMNLEQIASALYCGNVVVWKPSELSERVGNRLNTLFAEAGFPEGVFTAVPADRMTGEELVRAGCDKILFTGHGRTAQQILSHLAEERIPAILELSGMDAALVCADAAWEKAASALCWGTMSCSGQSCVASRRLIVHQDLWSKFVPVFLEAVRSLRLGDPHDPSTEVGPLRTEGHLEQLEILIEDAVTKGATLLSGGQRLAGGNGCFFEPTVMSHLNLSMRIVQEEFFGPVALLFPAKDEAEMVDLANENPYGLGASIWSSRLDHAEALARRIQAGTIWINDVLFSAGDVRLPFGGTKASGYGRVHGAEGLRQLMQLKCVQTHRLGGFRPYYFPYNPRKLKQLSDYLKRRSP